VDAVRIAETAQRRHTVFITVQKRVSAAVRKFSVRRYSCVGQSTDCSVPLARRIASHPGQLSLAISSLVVPDKGRWRFAAGGRG